MKQKKYALALSLLILGIGATSSPLLHAEDNLGKISAASIQNLRQEKKAEEILALLSPTDVEQPDESPEQKLLSTEYKISTGKTPLYISIGKSWNTGFASVYINNREIMKFRSGFANETPVQRAGKTALTLYQFLKDGGNPRRIQPGLEGKNAVIRAEHDILAVIDPKTASSAKTEDKQLALLWANNTREVLGAGSIERTHAPVSRGIIDHLQTTDLSGYRLTGKSQSGIASWYGPGFHGRRASDGSLFNMNALTAAHRFLPFGTRVRVFNHSNGKSCIVKITDRGPFVAGRIIDLSKQAARTIGMTGVSKVTIEVLAPEVSDAE